MRRFQQRKTSEEIDKKNRQRGSITVEALLILLIFMCAFWTLLNVARLARAQFVIQHAVTQTAKELSGYSYILTKFSQEDDMQSKYGKYAGSSASTEEITSNVQASSDSPSEGDGLEDILDWLDVDLQGMAIGMIAKARVVDYIDDVTGDADEYLDLVGIVGGTSGLDFWNCEYAIGEDAHITINVTYRMTNTMFPFIDLGETSYCQSAKTGVW